MLFIVKSVALVGHRVLEPLIMYPDIEEDIPFQVGKSCRNVDYPFHLMLPGHSVAYPDNQDGIKASRASYMYGQRHNMVFMTRRRVENGVNVIRIWRRV